MLIRTNGDYAGHGEIRERVMGVDDRAPTPAELDEMRALVRRAMNEGAFGLSTGLFYVPGYYATTEEVIELARVAAGFDGIYDTHDRDLEHASVTFQISDRLGACDRSLLSRTRFAAHLASSRLSTT